MQQQESPQVKRTSSDIEQDYTEPVTMSKRQRASGGTKERQGVPPHENDHLQESNPQLVGVKDYKINLKNKLKNNSNHY